MKKILLALIIILLFLLALPSGFASALTLAVKADTDCYIYSRTGAQGQCRLEGFCVVTDVKLGELHQTLGLCGEVLGVTAKLYGGEDAAFRLAATLMLRVVKIERLDGLLIIYAFSPLIAGFVPLFGTKVNVQIAVADDVVRIGSPLILGGY